MIHLPVNKRELLAYGWDSLDFLIISGDAYIDHPSFAAALLGRLLEDAGYRAGIIPQPDPEDPESLLLMGIPRLAVLIVPGTVDSMVNNYTAARKRRSDDRYSSGGKAGKRPDRAVIRYCNMVRRQMGDIPLVIGGIESSLRRFAHYDYWSDSVRRSILHDSGADILVYGMGEKPLLELAGLLGKGVPVHRINSLRGTCVLKNAEEFPGSLSNFLMNDRRYDFPKDSREIENPTKLDSLIIKNDKYLLLPSYEDMANSKIAYALATRHIYRQQDPGDGLSLVQRHGNRYLLQNPPSVPLTVAEMDHIYALPFLRSEHPAYRASGKIPALEEVSFSVTAHRGCFGGCHFCAITMHQGRIIQHRSRESILGEVARLTSEPDFKGYIHDVGGPTANFYRPACKKQTQGKVCQDRQCMFPKPCPALETDHKPWLETLKQIRNMPGIKKAFIRSGIRYDYLLLDRNSGTTKEICRYHVSGQLKVAPEHVNSRVLESMGKPSFAFYEKFKDEFEKQNRSLGMKQYLVPYWISGHPGSSLEAAIELALFIKSGGVIPEQVQDFYPTPGTISTSMYYTGINPLNMEKVHVPDEMEKKMQRALLQYNRTRNRKLVIQALEKTGRTDLIGTGKDKLIQGNIRDGFNKGNANKSKMRAKQKEDHNHAHNNQWQGTGSQAARGTERKNRSVGKRSRKAGSGGNPGR